MSVRSPVADDLPAMATLAATCQADPAQHIPYLGLDADSIANDVCELERWTAAATVAEIDGSIAGWLVAETDGEMGRLWWWGPFIPDPRRWDEIADRLYLDARSKLPGGFGEEEACGDDRNDLLRHWCARHRFRAEVASVILQRERGPTEVDPRVRPMAPGDHPTVQALHDLAFAGTHTTPEALVRSDEPRLVIELDGRVVGYVAYELQSDGSGYIDYLAVDEALRGAGIGGALVDNACHEMFAAGALHANLTVRENNAAARALYRRLGFVEERLARPYRIGFHLP